MLYGSEAAIEIEDGRVVLTARSGASEDLSPVPEPDDSYHPGWFARMAAEFEGAIQEGPGSFAAVENLAETRSTLALLMGAQESNQKQGGRVKIV